MSVLLDLKCVCKCVGMLEKEEKQFYTLFLIRYTMSESIQCNFARCAVQHFVSGQRTANNHLPRGKMPTVVRNYNKHFASEENLQVSCSQASKKFPPICKIFSNKWNPKELRESYLSAFGIEAWSTLTADKKAKRTLQKCRACEAK